MDIENKIRSRLETILVNDAKNYAELRSMAPPDEPLNDDPFAEERSLYQRIISSYRNAVSEVNNLLEENVSFLSGICKVFEGIKEKQDFQEICSQIVDCFLKDLGAEYCGLVFNSLGGKEGAPLYFEGIKEGQEFLFSHTRPTLLGNHDFAKLVSRLTAEASDCVTVADVYREARFNDIDFPTVVRALACMPIIVGQNRIGALVLSHSLPRFFTPNHTRVLRTLAATVAHVYMLTAKPGAASLCAATAQPPIAAAGNLDSLSIVLLNFESDEGPRGIPVQREFSEAIRCRLASTLSEKDSILAYENRGLLVLLPGTSDEQLRATTTRLRVAFDEWKADRRDSARSLRLSLGSSTCENGDDLARTVGTAAMMMLDDQDRLNEPEPVPAARRR